MPKLRLYAKKKLKLPKPSLKKKSDRGFSLRTIDEADKRFHVVKVMRQRIATLMEDVNADTIAKEWLCGHAIHIHAYLESQEIEAIESGKEIYLRDYLMAVRALLDVLSKLGLDKAVKGTQTLENYLTNAGKRKNKATESDED